MQFIPYNSRDIRHKSIFGCVAAGEVLRLAVLMPRSFGVSRVTLVINRDGEQSEQHDMFWCGLEGDSDEWWDIYPELPDTGLYFYYFSYETAFGGSNIFLKSSGMGEFAPDGKKWQLTVYDKSYKTPDSIKGGIMYQIFPDRFYDSGTKKSGVPKDRIIHRDKSEMPEWKPNADGKILNNDYYGGDLAGITEKLPYLKSLGVTVIYLNPIFEAHSNHRYNTADYLKIDPLLGDEADLKKLFESAKKLSIKVILDGVFSHTGSDSIYFNREKRYGDGGAYNDPASRFRPWYHFKPDGKYKSWWGIETLPETDEENDDFIRFITGKGGVAEKWLKLGASGFRLDVADELPDKFLDAFYKAVKSHNPENYIVSEVWEDASDKESYGKRRRYLLGGQTDSVMNYPFAAAILSFMRYGVAESFMETVVTICENYPKETVDVLMNHIGTHDTARILSQLCSYDLELKPRRLQAEHTLSADEYSHAVELLKTAVVLQYTLPGIPCIYYGDEAGLYGGGDPFNRKFYPWGHEDAELVEFYQKMGNIRHTLKSLKTGVFKPYSAMLSCVAYIRECDTEVCFIVANRNPHSIDYRLPDEFAHKINLLTGKQISDSVTVPPFGAAIIR